MSKSDNAFELVDIRVLSRSDPNIRPGFVQIEMTAPVARMATGVFELSKLSNDPTPLFKMAGELGVAMLRATQKSALLKLFEARVAESATDDQLPLFEPVDQPGWYGDVFVTPREVYGAGDRKIYRTFDDVPLSLTYQRAGSLDDWKESAGRMMKGNSMLIFFACVALMPPLLRLLKWPFGCGFALIGRQGQGKSSLLKLVGSIAGGGDGRNVRLVDSWRVAPNALERPAFFANDRTIILDDAQSLPGNDAQRAAVFREQIFMLIGGRGKERMGYGPPPEWMTVPITSHNATVRAFMANGGQSHDEAAEVRLIEIPCGRRHGVFDQLHDDMRAGAFADALTRRSERYYGTPFHEFLNHLTKEVAGDRAKITAWFEERIKRMQHEYLEISDDEDRVSKYFGLAYAAGRFAEEFCGIMPVSQEEIKDAVMDVYHAHRRHVGETTLQLDPVAVLRQYIEQNIVSFSDQRKGRSSLVKGEPVGYITEGQDGKEYAFRSRQFRLAIGTFTSKRACDALKAAGLLVHENGGEASKNSIHRTIFGEVQRVYCVPAHILDRERK